MPHTVKYETGDFHSYILFIFMYFSIAGGPLFCQRPNGMYVLHGIYSWGRCGAEERKPAIYIRFSYYAKWIRKVMSYYAKTSLG